MRKRLSAGKRSINKNNFIAFLFLLIMVRLIVVFVIQSDAFNMMYAAIIGFFGILMCILSSKRYGVLLVSKENIYLAYCFAYLSIVFLLAGSLRNREWVMTDIKSMIFLFIVIGFYIYLDYFCEYDRKKFFLWMYFLGFSVSLAATLYVEIAGGGDLVRNTAKGARSDAFGFVYGGYDFVYLSLVNFIVLLTVLKEDFAKIETKKKIILILIMALDLAVITLSNYTTALGLLVIFSIYSLMPNDFRKYFIIAVLIFGFRYYSVKIIELIDHLPFVSALTKIRINNILMNIMGMRTEERYLTGRGQRWDRVLWTWQTIKKYPFLGSYISNGRGRMGGHTQWIDDCGRYGIIYITVFALFWIGTYKKISESVQRKNLNANALKNAFLLFFVLGFLNPIGIPIMSSALYICAPFSEYAFLDKKYIGGTAEKPVKIIKMRHKKPYVRKTYEQPGFDERRIVNESENRQKI